jgi:diguanylate cyclase (GGDEF)-like protein/PAS domain S-box-containing protein
MPPTSIAPRSRALPLLGGVCLLFPLLFPTPLAWLPALGFGGLAAHRLGVAALPTLVVLAFTGSGLALWLGVDARGTVGLETVAVVLALWLPVLVARLRDDARSALARRFRAIIENTDALILLLEPDGRVRYANPAFRALIPASAPDDVEVVALLDADDAGTLRDGLRRIQREGGLPVSLPPLRLAGTGDEARWVEIRLAMLTGLDAGTTILASGRDVTGQIQAEHALRRSETRFSNLFAASQDALVISRVRDGVALDFNAAFSRLTGFSRDDGIGVPVLNLYRLADTDDLRRFMKLLDRDGEVLEFDTELVTRDGRTREVAIAGRYGEVDGELCVIAVFRDVSDTRRTRHALQESEARFSRIFHRSPDAMVLTRLIDGVVLDINERFCELFGVERGEIAGRPLTDRRPAQGGLALAGHQQDAADVDREAPLTAELEFRTAGGFLPTLLSTTVAEIDGEECAITVLRDQRALREAQARGAESEARFRGAFEHAPVGMMLVDPKDRRILEVNPRLCGMLGRDARALVGTPMVRCVHEADRAEHEAFVSDLLSGRAGTERAETRFRSADGGVLWTDLHLFAQRGEDDEPRLLLAQIADITEMKESQERMRKLAFYDTLTDLANRRLFADRLEQAARHSARTGQCSALLYLDLDDFKRVNDTLGHEAGDELLRTVARRLKACVREEDTVGRPGGDEFTLLLNEVRGARAAEKVARKIVAALEAPIPLGSQSVRVTTSIGITVAPDDGTDPQVLTRNADLAMYRAKERGRNNYQFFAEEMNARARERMDVENGLRDALERDGFVLAYQPKLDLTSREVVGVEALVRWRHPRRGELTPAAFMQVAEETGLICEIGDVALATACRDLPRVQAAAGRPVSVSVNLSARQFADPELVDRVRRALDGAGVDGSELELEITETLLLGQAPETLAALETLRELGVRLSVDDFGTGHSSLADLKRLPLDAIKIDQRFVAELPAADDAAITSAIIAMAHRLQLAVVAEGVETVDQMSFLEAQGCDAAQGYLFGAPMPLDELLADLGERREGAS